MVATSSKSTVKVYSADATGNYIIINADDYDAAVHTLWGDDTKLPIVSGVVTVPDGDGDYTLETEGAAATDDVDQVTGMSIGDILTIRAADDDHTVVLKNGTYLKLGADFALNNIYDMAELQCTASGVLTLRGGRTNAGD